MKKYFYYLFALIIGSLIGFTLREILNVNTTSQLTVGELSHLILTLALAFLIPFYIDRRLTNKRAEKDIIIDQAKGIKETLDSIREKVTDSYHKNSLTQDDIRTIKILFKTLANRLTELMDELAFCEIGILEDSNEEFTSAYFQYKSAVTGNKFEALGFLYDAKLYENQERAYSKLKKLMNRIIIEVNRL